MPSSLKTCSRCLFSGVPEHFTGTLCKECATAVVELSGKGEDMKHADAKKTMVRWDGRIMSLRFFRIKKAQYAFRHGVCYDAVKWKPEMIQFVERVSKEVRRRSEARTVGSMAT